MITVKPIYQCINPTCQKETWFWQKPRWTDFVLAFSYKYINRLNSFLAPLPFMLCHRFLKFAFTCRLQSFPFSNTLTSSSLLCDCARHLVKLMIFNDFFFLTLIFKLLLIWRPVEFLDKFLVCCLVSVVLGLELEQFLPITRSTSWLSFRAQSGQFE